MLPNSNTQNFPKLKNTKYEEGKKLKNKSLTKLRNINCDKSYYIKL